MTSQKRVRSWNTKSPLSLQSKKETVLSSMKEELWNFLAVLKLSWKLTQLRYKAYFLRKSSPIESIKPQAKPSQTSLNPSTQEAVSKSQKGSLKKDGSPRSTPKKAVSSSTKQPSKASTSPKRKPSQNT